MDAIDVAAALRVSGLAFVLLFLQTGLDLMHVNRIEGPQLAIFGVAGLLCGTLGVAANAAAAWLGMRLLGVKCSVGKIIRAFGMAFSPTLVYSFVGLFFNMLFDWNTVVAFGVTGVLWALGPMVAVLGQILDGRTGAAAVLSAICGLMTLYIWSRILVLL